MVAATKCYISELLHAKLIKKEGWNLNTVQLVRGEASLVNVMGLVVNNNDNSLLLDDGTGVLAVKSFGDLPKITVGSTVQVIGRPAMYENHPLLVAQVLSNVQEKWLSVRKKELGDVPAIITTTKAVIEEVINTDNVNGAKDELLALIRKSDKGDGVEVTQLLSNPSASQQVLDALLREGEIFELKPGVVKVLE